MRLGKATRPWIDGHPEISESLQVELELIRKDIFGVITENKQIADSHRNMFELTWQNTP